MTTKQACILGALIYVVIVALNLALVAYFSRWSFVLHRH